MLKKILFLFILVISCYTASAQNYNWITPNQVYLKTYVINNGIYRIQKSDFENAGISTSSIDPRTVKVYCKGNQVPIYFYGEQDGIFNDTDYFDFYGQRNYGGLTNYYTAYNQVAYTKDEYINYYSDTSAYWIGWGGAFGLRFADFSTPSSTPYPMDYFFSKNHFEKDTYYSLGENWGPTDYRNFSNDLFQGEGWYWKSMAFMNTISDTFSTPYKTVNTQTCFLKIFAYPGNQSATITNEHHLVLKINNNTFPDTLYANHFNRIDTTIVFPSSYLNQSGVNTITIRYAPPVAYSSGIMNLDMAEISYSHRFEFDNNSVRFNSTVTDPSPYVFKIKGYNPANPVSIYDVKNNLRITTYQISADTLIFSGKANGNYEIYNKFITLKPFRIKQKQVPDLVSASNGADYLLVYNKLFETQAEQLRQFRATNFRSKKAEIEDIYDIFNYGMESPVAVRNLMIYASSNWQGPAIKFLCLFGRGSIDPKKNIITSQYYQNLVPVYGNPVTDGYFANLHPGSFTYSWQTGVGRIPVISVEEAQIAVNKLIAYETEPLDTWIKEPIFITSGRDRYSETEFINASETFVNAFIIPPPISSLPIKIYKNDSVGYPTFNLRDSTKNAMNRGGLLTNYIGHSGDTKWENCMDDPSILTNGLKLPGVFSMTCFTGAYGNADSRSFGESFFLNPNGGALGFVGSTAWSFSGSGNDFNGYLIRSMMEDSCRYLGDIVKFANFILKNDSANFAVRNTLNCYNLIGDPASRLLLPTHPEFDVNLQDCMLTSPNPALRENDLLTVTPKNLGTYADSCKIRFKILKFNQVYKQKDTVVHFFSYRATVNFNFSIDTTGIFDMMVILDPDNWYPLDDKSNDVVEFPIILKNSSYVPVKPEDNMMVQTDSVNFVGLNPQINLINNTVKVILELDSTIAFNSGFKQTYFKIVNSGVVSKFKIRIPSLDTNILYFWRATATINNDTTGWAQVRKFYYRPPGVSKPPRENTKNIVSTGDLEKENSKEMSLMTDSKTILRSAPDSLITILKKSTNQFTNNLFNIKTDRFNNIVLSNYISNLYAKGYGMNAYEISYFVANNLMYLSDGDTNYGLNLLKVRKLDCKVREYKNMVFNNASYNDSVLNFLNTFDSSSYLMVYNASYTPGGVGFNSSVRNKFRQFGSVYADTIPVIGWFHTWSFIGFLGAGPSQVSEQYHPCCPQGWIPSISQLNPLSYSTHGSMTSTIGPAQRWKNFQWSQILYPNSSIAFDVYGIDRNNLTSLLYTNLTNSNLILLDTLNAYNFPNLKLVANLNIDTIVGTQSPVFKSLTFRYQPPAELVIDSIAFHNPGVIIGYGDEIKVDANCFNVGYSNAYGVVGNWYVYTNSGFKYILKSDTLHSVLYIDSMFKSKTILTINYFPPDIKKFYNVVTLRYEVKALGQQNDYYDFNNIASINIIMKNGPPIVKKINVLADGIQLMGGDYVRQKPEMTVKSGDDKTHIFAITDSSTFKVFINNNYFPVQNNITDNIKRADKSEDNKKAINTLSFYPDLRLGENNLKFIMKSSDGRYADTVAYSVFVSNELSIKDLVNYPNPMKNETSFLFNLAGAVRPAGCKIKIYTVSGRLIKIINSSVNIGYNQIPWDGRDNDGEFMANGVYFYQLIIEGDTKKEVSLQKLVILK